MVVTKEEDEESLLQRAEKSTVNVVFVSKEIGGGKKNRVQDYVYNKLHLEEINLILLVYLLVNDWN